MISKHKCFKEHETSEGFRFSVWKFCVLTDTIFRVNMLRKDNCFKNDDTNDGFHYSVCKFRDVNSDNILRDDVLLTKWRTTEIFFTRGLPLGLRRLCEKEVKDKKYLMYFNRLCEV
jgi:hypothetical protein